MSKYKFTPGPWKKVTIAGFYQMVRLHTGEHQYIEINQSGAKDSEENKANANLIEQAPALVEVVEQFLWELVGSQGIRDEAHAVLAKVRGEEK